MLVSKSLQVAIRPGVQNPVLNVGPGRLSLVLGFVPAGLHRGDQAVFVRLSSLLGLDTLGLQVSLQLLVVPVLVRRDGIGIPVLLDQVLEILAVGRGGVGDVVIREPSLQLSLVPFVVG